MVISFLDVRNECYRAHLNLYFFTYHKILSGSLCCITAVFQKNGSLLLDQVTVNPLLLHLWTCSMQTTPHAVAAGVLRR